METQGTSYSQVGDGVINPTPIRCPYITTKQLDGDLGEVLEIFRQNGIASNYGALLFESLPISRYAFKSNRLSCYTNTVQAEAVKVLSNLSDRTLAGTNNDWQFQNRGVLCLEET
jgi:hypothetical protein